MNKRQFTFAAIVGALGLITISFLIWTMFNFDVLIKAIQYPQAVRDLDIEVRVAQFSK